MIASLPMYDRAQTAGANDALWSAIQAELGYGPAALTRGGDIWMQWRDPTLLLSQTCGLPYRAKLHNEVQLVGTPDYGVTGCAPGWYRSVLVSRKDDPRVLKEFDGACLAFNEPLSQSGWAAPMAFAAKHDITFGSGIKTGAHVASAQAVAKGQADLAALDVLTWAMIKDYDAFARDLRVVDLTDPTPGLPYVTAKGQDAAQIFTSIEKAIAGLPQAIKARLHLKGIVALPHSVYMDMDLPDPPDTRFC